MTGAEYRDTIARLGLTQVQAGKFLGVDARTSRRWIAGQSAIPHSAAILLRLMDRRGMSVDAVHKLTAREI